MLPLLALDADMVVEVALPAVRRIRLVVYGAELATKRFIPLPGPGYLGVVWGLAVRGAE